MSIGEKTRLSLYWKLSLKIPYEIVRFGVSIIVARLLDPKDFGVMAIAAMIIGYANSITSLGFNQALVQSDEIDNSQINSAFVINFSISLILTIIFFLFASQVAVFFHSPESKNVIKVLSLIFLLTTFYDIPISLLIRNIDFKIISLVESFQGFFSSFITVILAFYGFKYWSLVFGQLIPLMGAMTYLLYKVSWTPRLRYNHNSIKKLYNFGFWSLVRAQLHYFDIHIDRFIVGRVLGIENLGLYDKSLTISYMPIESMSMNINTVMFPSFSRVQDNKKLLREIFEKSLVVTSLIHFPIFTGLFFVAPYFVVGLLGKKWIPIILPIKILSFAGIIMSLLGLISQFNVGVGNYKEHTLRACFSSFILTIGCLILARVNISGAALCVLIYKASLFFLIFHLVKRKIDFSWFDFFRITSPILWSTFLMMTIVKISSKYFFPELSFLNLFILILIGVLSYFTFIIWANSPILKDIKSSFYRDVIALRMKIVLSLRKVFGSSWIQGC